MGKKDPRVDAYIAKSPEFARPILTYLREIIHEGCPDVTETIKWRTPTFDHQGILAGIAAFKQYCTLGFWKAPLLKLDGKPVSKEMESRSEEHTSELQSPCNLVCRLLLEKKKKNKRKGR